MIIPLIKVELTPDIAVKLRFMMEAGIFDIRGGNAVLSFDATGHLKSIKRELFTYALPVNSEVLMKKDVMIKA